MALVADEQPPQQSLWMTGKQAAPLIGVDTSTVYRWIKIGQLRATKVGSQWYIRREDIEALLGGAR